VAAAAARRLETTRQTAQTIVRADRLTWGRCITSRADSGPSCRDVPWPLDPLRGTYGFLGAPLFACLCGSHKRPFACVIGDHGPGVMVWTPEPGKHCIGVWPARSMRSALPWARLARRTHLDGLWSIEGGRGSDAFSGSTRVCRAWTCRQRGERQKPRLTVLSMPSAPTLSRRPQTLPYLESGDGRLQGWRRWVYGNMGGMGRPRRKSAVSAPSPPSDESLAAMDARAGDGPTGVTRETLN